MKGADEGLRFTPQEIAELTTLSPAERRSRIRARVAGAAERDRDGFLAGVIDQSTEAAATMIERQARLCPVCGGKRDQFCLEHLDLKVRELQAGAGPRIGTFAAGPPSVTIVAAQILSGLIASGSLPEDPGFWEKLGSLAMDTAERLVKLGHERDQKIRRDLGIER